MLERIGVSLEDELLEKFDRFIGRQGYTNRSEAIRDLIREKLVQQEWSRSEKKTMGVVSIVYDHHTLELSQKLAELQHDHYASVVASMHVHLDHDNCLEVLILRGKVSEIEALGNSLISTRGVKHGKLVPTTTGKDLC